ncbi:hypothetical protein NJC11_18005 [Pseudomonas aeruginosa]|uniref:hypothetical protein n=1 Tax=Pseudomonas aeruginosa TaxID=287 RepID=UPI00209A7939|nr:hypothetical protein [Pseudomonas aeruginosa]MCO7653378.1 hypothetical protein [Pseudomonas aeruginosa]
MSSTQHQLIEQCATRLRGIVEALDNIHDNTPHRWSTDLDEVHSSAESLLAMIKDQAPPSEDQLIAAGLSYPLAKEDAVQLWYAGFRSEVVTVLEAWEAIGHDIGMNPSKGELLDSLRNMAAICNAHGNDMPAQSAIDQRQAIADAITGALAFGAQASRPPPADHWLRPFYDIGRAEGQRTQELAMLVRMLASSLKRHAPESNLVARATNYLAAKGLAGTPLRDAPASVEQVGGDERAAFELFVRKHCGMPAHIAVNWDAKFTNDAWAGWQARAALAQPSPAQAEQAEAEDPEMSPERAAYFMRRFKSEEKLLGPNEQAAVDYVLSLLAQHDRIVGALRDELEAERKRVNIYVNNNTIRQDNERLRAELRDALARVAGLELGIARIAGDFLPDNSGQAELALDEMRQALHELLAAAPTQAQHSVPKAWLDVQAERRRQVENEGWTPEHDDEHADGQMARAAACYALAGSSAPNDGTAALLVSLAWPWDEQWWKPSTARRDLVKACALALAEIERLDRACISQSPQPGATTASS